MFRSIDKNDINLWSGTFYKNIIWLLGSVIFITTYKYA